jgi:hypothetical protein
VQNDECAFGAFDDEGELFTVGASHAGQLIIGQCCGREDFKTFDEAAARCNKHSDICGGITKNNNDNPPTYTTRDAWFSLQVRSFLRPSRARLYPPPPPPCERRTAFTLGGVPLVPPVWSTIY